MIRMSFTLEMDRPIEKGKHYVSPGGYCLRFNTPRGPREVNFDFLDFEGTIVKEKFLECNVYNLDVDSFEGSAELLSLLRNSNYDWVEFFVYTGEYEDPKIQPVRAFNILIEGETYRRKLKDYVFEDPKNYVSVEMFNSLKSILSKAVKFCVSRQMLVKGGGIRFFENAGCVYLCTKVGNGYCYDLDTDEVTSVGFVGSKDSLAAAKSIISGVLGALTTDISLSVKSIFIPYGPVKGCYYKESRTEPGSYNLIFE